MKVEGQKALPSLILLQLKKPNRLVTTMEEKAPKDVVSVSTQQIANQAHAD